MMIFWAEANKEEDDVNDDDMDGFQSDEDEDEDGDEEEDGDELSSLRLQKLAAQVFLMSIFISRVLPIITSSKRFPDKIYTWLMMISLTLYIYFFV